MTTVVEATLLAGLRALGHRVVGWSLGTNRGPTGHVVRELRARLDQLHRDSGRRVSLVGWSLGATSHGQMLAQDLTSTRYPGEAAHLRRLEAL